MGNDETRKEYLKRIHSVIDFIEKNLDQELSVELLSKKAFYSPFHFHRLFTFIIGETLNAFINRKRMERIAGILVVGTGEPITELAFRYGFSSGNAFSRAFRNFYGMSPTEFKIKGKGMISKKGVEAVSIEKYIYRIDDTLKWIAMNGKIEVKELPEIKLIGLAHIGEYDKIGQTYENLVKWVAPKGILHSRNLKAATIYHDNPRITEMSKVRLSCCFTVDGDVTTDGDVRCILIRKGRFAVGRFEISAGSFSNAWDSMCVWVVENGFNFRDGEYFELYHNDHRTHPEKKFIVDICIPVM